MGESKGRAVLRDLRLLLLPVAIALLIGLAFAVRAVQANHGDTHVSLVDTADPSQDISNPETPLVLQNVGDTAEIDLMVRLPGALDDVYAGEFHLSVEPRGIVRVLDAEIASPGINFATD